TAAVVGGIGSIPGAVLGGLLIGGAESVVTGHISSTYSHLIVFGILIVVMPLPPSEPLGRAPLPKVGRAPEHRSPGAEGGGRRAGGQAGAPTRVPAVLAGPRAAGGRADRLVPQAGDRRAGRPGPAAARPGRFPAAGRHRRAGGRGAGSGAEHRGGLGRAARPPLPRGLPRPRARVRAS